MKKILLSLCIAGTLTGIPVMSAAQSVFSLDSCRMMALTNNKDVAIWDQKVQMAALERKVAFGKNFPHVEIGGGYMFNSRNISLMAENAMLPVLGFNPSTGAPFPTGEVALLPKEALEVDIQNVFIAGASLIQPIYMGGKIQAYNRITKFAEQIAANQKNVNLQDVIIKTDETYWQIVSLVNKKKLAAQYLALLEKLDADVKDMMDEGVATRADYLSVQVKLNEAQMTLTKVNNGITLSKMLLSQLCGLALDTDFSLEDQQMEEGTTPDITGIDIAQVVEKREEVKSLSQAVDIYREKQKITRSEYLPNIALSANYVMMSPSFYEGIQNSFKGIFNAGVIVRIPVFGWVDMARKNRIAKSEIRIAELQKQDAQEKITLQINQSIFRVNEATDNVRTADKNMEKAEENLMYANEGYKEGVMTLTNVFEAQSGWISAQSEKIDSQIDMKMADTYLKRATGTLLSE